MLVFYNHLTWFIFIGVLFMSSFSFMLWTLFNSSHLYISFKLLFFDFFPIDISFYFDWISITFMSVVLLISSSIIVYSYNYMAPYSNSSYFLWLTILFVFSILLVITISNLLFLIIGWDGLGLISFFLIVYYQNSSSVYSGIFTLLMNRVGDCFFLLSISLMFYVTNSFFSFSSDLTSFSLLIVIVVAFMTNSAIYPFSPWLPLAIAAPTPISALVHSSTLVTAGLYLIMRYSYVLYSFPSLMTILLVFSLFTSFYAGMNSIFEVDLNKLIALSTLSHLGFIGLSFSAGLVQLSFFHLLTHALFNSLLFMTIGDIIINLNHSQDIRYLSSGVTYTPISCYTMYLSLFNLLGLPNLSGFFSNDLILEMCNYSYFSFSLLFILYINLFFTYFYTLQLFFYSYQHSNVSPYQIIHPLSSLHVSVLIVMAFFSLVFGAFFITTIYPLLPPLPLPPLPNFVPFLFISLVLLFFILRKSQFLLRSSHLAYYFSNMIYLSIVIINITSRFFYKYIFVLVRSTEIGSYSFIINSYFSTFCNLISSAVIKQLFFNPLPPLLVFSCLLISISMLLSNNINYYSWLLPINSP